MRAMVEETGERLRAVAIRVAAEAADLVRTMRDDAVRADAVENKHVETDVVTAADRAAERLVRDRLAALRPGDPVLGEEEGGRAELDGLRWIVDPIDGTVNYVSGFPWYAVSVAVQHDGRTVAGAVAEPAADRMWSAAEGGGAFLDDRRLRGSAASRLDHALVSTGFGCTPAQRAGQIGVVGSLLGDVRDLRRCGTASLDLCAVAAGWTDGYYEAGLNRWDWAAGALIAAEAGAEVHVRATDSPDDDVITCAAPGIADELHAALRRCGAVVRCAHTDPGQRGHCWFPTRHAESA